MPRADTGRSDSLHLPPEAVDLDVRPDTDLAAEFDELRCEHTWREVIQIADVRSRVAALEFWIREGFGRAPQADMVPAPLLPDDPTQVAKLSWDELRMLGALHLREELTPAGVERKLRKLSPRARRVLRSALERIDEPGLTVP